MFANATGFGVGWLAAKSSLGISNADFIYGARFFFKSFDLWYSVIKSACFAGAVTIIPCYIGFNTKQGAEGVGRATTDAVVFSSVSILLLDVILTQLLLTGQQG
jgi:phospholipid/cholesterol/gamma-HCH transport system permease protein